MDQEPLIRRLTLPRFLFRTGEAALGGPDPYASGLATSLFQDSVEAFLRILAETGKVNVGPQVSFDNLFGKVSESYPSVSGHQAALFRLNKARVAFKHNGLSVAEDDALHFQESVRAFLTEVTLEALGLDFAAVSLVSTIGHRRTENWLRKAHEAVAAGHYSNAMVCAAKAFHIYVNARAVHRTRVASHRFWGPPSHNFRSASRELRLSLTEFARWAVAHFEEVNKSVDLLSHGLDIMAYWRFSHLTPGVSESMTGALSTDWDFGSTADPTKEDTEFCIAFVIDSALRIGANHRREDIPISVVSGGKVEATDTTVVTVYPKDDSEVIRSVSAGEKLTIVSGHVPQAEGFIAVFQDGEVAFVPVEHVRHLSGNCDREEPSVSR